MKEDPLGGVTVTDETAGLPTLGVNVPPKYSPLSVIVMLRVPSKFGPDDIASVQVLEAALRTPVPETHELVRIVGLLVYPSGSGFSPFMPALLNVRVSAAAWVGV